MIMSNNECSLIKKSRLRCHRCRRRRRPRLSTSQGFLIRSFLRDGGRSYSFHLYGLFQAESRGMQRRRFFFFVPTLFRCRSCCDIFHPNNYEIHDKKLLPNSITFSMRN